MKNIFTRHFLLVLVCIITSIGLSNAQYVVQGTVQSVDGEPAVGAIVATMPETVVGKTDVDGHFLLEMAEMVKKVMITYNGVTQETDVTSTDKNIDLGDITLEANIVAIPFITLTDAEVDDIDTDSGDDQSFSGILSASRDPFLNAAAFNFSPAYFRFRGLSGLGLYVNGMSMTELESNFAYFSIIGGLNDATRNSTSQMGPDQLEFAFGDMVGTQNIDITASSQRKQTKVSYASSNRSYRNRIMFIHSTGKQKNGWSFSLSGSKRWAEEGVIPGTDYNAYAYYAAAEKEIGRHKIGLSILGSPNKRSKSGISVAETHELTGTNYYNPNWGYQEGKVRNARVGNNHTPMAFLTHKWEIDDTWTLNTTLNIQSGRIGTTNLDWYKANDPRPDYYRNLPSYGDVSAEYWLANNQVDWTHFYNVNRQSLLSVEDANGIEGNTHTGLRSRYIVEEKRYDNRKFNFNTTVQKNLNDKVTLNGGLVYRSYKGMNYKTLEDLLGGEYYLNIDNFGERDFPAGSDQIQLDLNNPNRILAVGDRFGYDYEVHIKNAQAWGQVAVTTGRLDYYVGGEFSNTSFWRKGNYKNGNFPDNSFGNSEKQKFNNFGIKGGATFKINGKNFVYARSMYKTNAPRVRDAYLSPRTRDNVADGLKSNKVLSVEGGYVHNSAKTKLRFTGFIIDSKDNFIKRNAYIDRVGSFINLNYQGVDFQNLGLEFGFEQEIISGLAVKGGASIGDYIYTSRPTLIETYDNSAEVVSEQKIYLENYYLPSPQIGGNLGLAYNAKNYWGLYLDVNYFAKNYVGVNPLKHTTTATEPLEYQSEIYYSFLDQAKNDDVVMVNLSGRKSWKVKDYYINLNVGVSNILNNQNLVNRSYEQLRYDTDNINKFPNRYNYALGINYYAGVSVRF